MHPLDQLTALPTRYHLAAHLENCAGDSWIIRVDLDSLVFVNAHLGYEFADEALCRVADALASFSGELGGAAFRVCGDDFVLLLPHIPALDLQRRLLLLRDGLALSDYSFGDHPCRPANELSVSFLALPLESLVMTAGTELLDQLNTLFDKERLSTARSNEGVHFDRPLVKRSFITLISDDA